MHRDGLILVGHVLGDRFDLEQVVGLAAMRARHLATVEQRRERLPPALR